jgi:predicted dithiol-disulfide oxidoreductase (DUF899 family)
MAANGHIGKPDIVTVKEWQKAREELQAAEKEATRLLDTVAARRRRLPMAPFDSSYTFQSHEGAKTLLDLFGGRNELIVYQFMDNGPENYCPGCTWYTNNIPEHAPQMLADKGITYVTSSNMRLAQVEAYWKKLGWTIPYVSSHGTSFARDIGAGGGFMLTFFLRDGDDVYRTYNTTSRGYEKLAFVTGLLDMSAYGRREDWEDSPDGWPQGPTYLMPTSMEPGQVSTGFGTFR